MTMTSTAGLHKKPPDTENWFIAPVVADWFQTYIDEGNLHKDFALPGSRIRASWAGDCARAIAYRLAGVEESDPITVADAWRFNIGTLAHEHIQAAVEKAYPGSTSEVKVRIGEDGSGHMDMHVVREDGRTAAVEIKTTNGFGFKKMTLGSNPEGVRIKYLYQGALNAAAMDPQPDELVIAVFSLECVSPGEAAKNGLHDEYRRFAAQWTYDKDEYLALAQREMTRLARIAELTDASEYGWVDVPRMIPDPTLQKHIIIDPAKGILELQNPRGEPEGLGHTWHCGYCSFQSHCIEQKKTGR